MDDNRAQLVTIIRTLHSELYKTINELQMTKLRLHVSEEKIATMRDNLSRLAVENQTAIMQTVRSLSEENI